MLDLAFRFTPADGTPSRNIKVTIATQDDEKYPLSYAAPGEPQTR